MILHGEVGLAYHGLLAGQQTAILGILAIIHVGPSWATPHRLQRDPWHRYHQVHEGHVGQHGRLGAGDGCSQGVREQLQVYPHGKRHASNVLSPVRLIHLQHSHAEPPDKQSLLALAWKTLSLGTFASGLRKLGRRHTAAPNKPEWKILEEQLQAEMALGRSPSTIKTVLSAAIWAVSMGIAKHGVPGFFGSMSRGRRTPGTTRRSCGDRLRPCKQWLPKPNTLPSGRWWQQQ